MRNELLVIEDTNLHLSIVSKIASQAGFTTTGANSVGEAARLLRERSFDCITLDLSLGEESGVEVLKLLAEMKCRTPIIVVSGSGRRSPRRDDQDRKFPRPQSLPADPEADQSRSPAQRPDADRQRHQETEARNAGRLVA